MQQAVALKLIRDGADLVRVGVAPSALDQCKGGPARGVLLDAAIRSFRMRATRAGYPADLIESEIARFREQAGGRG